jgi:anti-sigma factor RsiW
VNCRECTDFLHDYLGGELPETQRRIFEGHIQLCPPCLTYLDSYRKTVTLGALVKDEPVDPLPEALVQAILAAKSST